MHENVHIYQSSFRHESRILKITKSLVDAGVFSQVDILAAWEAGQATFEPIDAQRRVRRLKTRLGRRDGGKLSKLCWVAEWLLRTTIQTLRLRPTCVNCHSLVVLPIGVVAKWLVGCRLIYDTHELETETGNCRGIRQSMLKLVERFCIRYVDETIVVGQAIANWYRDTYGLPHVHVARNVPHRETLERLRTAGELSRSSSPLRKNLSIAQDELVFLYQG